VVIAASPRCCIVMYRGEIVLVSPYVYVVKERGLVLNVFRFQVELNRNMKRKISFGVLGSLGYG